MSTSRFAVIGGGVTGLAAAYELSLLSPEAEIHVLEGSDRIGGKLRTENFMGAQVETGADSFLTRDPATLELCRALGLAGELVAPAIFKGEVWDGHRRYPLPQPSVMGIPTSVPSALGAEGLTVLERLRAAFEWVGRGPLRGPDVDVATFVGSRFGRAVMHRFVDPLLAGTRAGAPDEMSLAAALPQIDAAARGNRSLMRALHSPASNEKEKPVFLRPRGGMTRLIEELSSQSGAEVRSRANVERVRRGGRELVLEIEGGDSIQADGIVVATPAAAAAHLLGDIAPGVKALEPIPHATVAVIALAFDRAAIDLPPDSSGFLVPSGADLTVSAGTWWSVKWPDTTPEDTTVVRCFVGRSGRHPALTRDDDDLTDLIVRDLGRLLGSDVTPLGSHVTRWHDGLPQYVVGHLDRVREAEQSVAAAGPIALAGADLRGSGIPDCLRQGRLAARRVHAEIARGGGKVDA